MSYINKTTIIIFIEGAIGSGKSTIVDLLTMKIHNSIAIKEKVEQWMDFNGVNLLHDKEKKFEAQTLINNTYESSILDLAYKDYDVIIFERSHVSATKIFAKYWHNEKLITDVQYKLLLKQMDTITDVLKMMFPNAIYLICKLTGEENVFEQRIIKRGYAQDNKIDRDFRKFIKDIYQMYKTCKQPYNDKHFVFYIKQDENTHPNLVSDNILGIISNLHVQQNSMNFWCQENKNNDGVVY